MVKWSKAAYSHFDGCMEYVECYESKVRDASLIIKQNLKFDKKPVFGIVLGSGLNDLADCISNQQVVDYREIQDFPRTTVPGHEGKLIYGELEGVPVLGLKGRKHYYEVADMPMNMAMLQVIFPVHVLAELGVQNYFATNAAGGLNPLLKIGDPMVIKSHINFLPNPLLGAQHKFKRLDGTPTWRFQPMNEAYDKGLTELLNEAAAKYSPRGIIEGTYLAVTGPTYETNGECIAFRDGLKADAVGMSTVPEVIVAKNRGMNCVGLSCITNVIQQDGTNATNHEEVKKILESPETKTMYSNTIKYFFKLYKERNL